MRSEQSSGLNKGAVLLGVTLGSGLVAGVALDVLTFVLARYGLQGDSWSLRGNGALIVPFGLGPAVLAGAWAAIVLHYRSSARWLLVGVGTGVIGALFVVASVAALVLVGSAGMPVSNSMTGIILVWMVVAPVLAGWLRVDGRPSHRALVAHVAAGLLFPVAMVAGFVIATLVLAPGS